jgi:MFS family permease
MTEDPTSTRTSPAAPASTAAAAPARPRARSPFRRRNFSLLFAGQLISALGDQAYGIALPWTVLAVTGDARQMAIVLTAGAVPRMLALLLGGALADRVSPRLVMLITDAGRAAVVAALGVTLFFGLPPLWVVAVLAAMEGLGTGFFQPSFPAITPSLVPADELPAANGMMMIIQFISLVLGPVLGGVATAAQASIAFLADGASFLASFVTLGAIRLPRRERQAAASGRRGMLADIGAGIRYAFAQPLIRTTLVISTLGNFGLSGVANVSLIVLSRNLSPSAITLGMLLAAIGVGGIVGGLSAGVVGRLRRRGVVVALVWAVIPVCFVAIPFVAGPSASNLSFVPTLAPDLRLPIIAGLLGLIGVFLALGDTVFTTIMQQKTDPNFLARVFSVQLLAGGVTGPLSLLSAGYLTAAFGPGSAFLAGAVIFVPASVLALLSRHIRQA